MGFEFPEKQGRLIDWWKKVISFIIEETGQTFVTYQDLVDLVTVEGLKPTPLKNMLNYLKNNHFLAAEPSLEQLAKEKALQAQQSQGGSWIKSLIGKVWGQSE